MDAMSDQIGMPVGAVGGTDWLDLSILKRANEDGINGDGAIARKRSAKAQRWRRSVRGRPWPGKNTSVRSLLPA